MKTIDCKCGVCGTVFPVQVEGYKRRFAGRDKAYTANIINCPSCSSEMPPTIQTIFMDLIEKNGKDSWEIGTNFLVKQP